MTVRTLPHAEKNSRCKANTLKHSRARRPSTTTSARAVAYGSSSTFPERKRSRRLQLCKDDTGEKHSRRLHRHVVVVVVVVGRSRRVVFQQSSSRCRAGSTSHPTHSSRCRANGDNENNNLKMIRSSFPARSAFFWRPPSGDTRGQTEGQQPGKRITLRVTQLPVAWLACKAFSDESSAETV